MINNNVGTLVTSEEGEQKGGALAALLTFFTKKIKCEAHKKKY